VTGNFEVTIVEANRLIHSKSTRGQGKCSTKPEVDAVIGQVGAYLAEKRG
jgi:hypothetical protein